MNANGEMSLEDRLAKVREAKAKKADAAAKLAEALEVEDFELEERFEQSTGGKRGERFEILYFGSDGGFVVVERGPGILFQNLSKSKVQLEDVSTFVLPQIAHPEKEEFKRRAFEMHGMWNACAEALTKLHKIHAIDLQGKASS